jgi:penicillin-binding protein 2
MARLSSGRQMRDSRAGFFVSYWFGNDNRLPQQRLAIVSYVIVGMVGLLLVGFWKLQVIDSDKFLQWAERNRVRSIPVIAPRGRMLDRDGKVLVDNYPSFSVLLLRDDPAQVEKNLPAISDGLGIPLEDLKQQLQNSRNLKNFQPIVIKPEASKADVAFIESHRADIPLLEMLMVHRRRYLPGGFMAHASGYVGEVSEQQIEASNGRFRPGDFVGKSGLEKQYNDLLQGTDGMRRVVVNSVGKEVDHLPTQEAIPGKQIQLTIDSDLQQVAEQSLGGRPGAVVALDPRSGEVLAMASVPSFDPATIDRRFAFIGKDRQSPLLNRATSGLYPPGSSFKIVTAADALDAGVVSLQSTFVDNGSLVVGNFVFHDDEGEATGTQDLTGAFALSSNVDFGQIALELGAGRWLDYASRWRLGEPIGFTLPSERDHVPSPNEMTPGVVAQLGFGQADLLVTPLRMALVGATIASGGTEPRPYMVRAVRGRDGAERSLAPPAPLANPIPGAVADQVRAMMEVVVARGTGTAAALPRVKVAGKTGTATLATGRSHAWFVAFAPADAPRVALAIVVENSGYGGVVAAPIARRVLATALKLR